MSTAITLPQFALNPSIIVKPLLGIAGAFLSLNFRNTSSLHPDFINALLNKLPTLGLYVGV